MKKIILVVLTFLGLITFAYAATYYGPMTIVGTIDGQAIQIVGSGAIDASSYRSAYIVCTSTCTVTPKAPAAGNQYCIRNAPASATVITLAALGASKYYELTDHSAWATANQKLVSAAGATAAICIVGYDATHYLTMNNTLAWTDTP